MANMFQFERDYATEYQKVRSLDAAKRIVPDLVPLKEWILENKSAFQEL